MKDWDSKRSILKDEPSLFYWNHNFNVDYKNNLWVADAEKHNIYYISKEKETWNAIFKVSGTEGTAGSRDGNIKSAVFNKPRSLYAYSKDLIKIEQEKALKPILMKEDYEEECKWANARNYTKCGILIEDDFPYDFIDHKQVKYISFARINKNELNETIRFDGLEEPREIYIADSANHCIRRIVVRQANVGTVAGICGKPGFKDGVYSTN